MWRWQLAMSEWCHVLGAGSRPILLVRRRIHRSTMSNRCATAVPPSVTAFCVSDIITAPCNTNVLYFWIQGYLTRFHTTSSVTHQRHRWRILFWQAHIHFILKKNILSCNWCFYVLYMHKHIIHDKLLYWQLTRPTLDVNAMNQRDVVLATVALKYMFAL